MNLQNDRQSNSIERSWRSTFSTWLSAALLWAMIIGVAFLDHAKGRSWSFAFGLPLDKNFLRPIGDFVIPVLAIMLMSRNIGKLPDSREKTVLFRICWWFFVFLLVWQLIRLFFLRPL
jgi:hypothetical protein